MIFHSTDTILRKIFSSENNLTRDKILNSNNLSIMSETLKSLYLFCKQIVICTLILFIRGVKSKKNSTNLSQM